MAKLNFKDLAGKVTKDIAYSSVQKMNTKTNEPNDGEGGFGLGSIPALGSRNGSVDINNDVDSLVVKTTSVDRDLGNNLLNAQTSSVELLNKTKGKNLFSLPSVITIGFFLLSTVYIDIDQSLEDGRFSTREMFKILYLGLGGLAALVARGSEGKTGVYSPNFLPGLSKEDFNETQQLQ